MSKPKQAQPGRLASPVQSPLSKTLKPTPKPKPKLKGYGGKTKTTGSKIKSLKGYGQTNKKNLVDLLKKKISTKKPGGLGGQFKPNRSRNRFTKRAGGGKIMQGYKKGGKV